VNSLEVSAAQTFCGVLAMYVTYTVLSVVMADWAVGLAAVGFSAIGFFFEILLEFGEGAKASAFVFADPAVGDFEDRHRIKVVELFASAALRGDQVRRFQQLQMFGNGLPAHVEISAQLAERLAVLGVQPIEQRPSAGVGESLEHLVHVRMHEDIMQPFGCMSRLTTATREEKWIRGARPR
jgi:hypothetical protein